MERYAETLAAGFVSREGFLQNLRASGLSVHADVMQLIQKQPAGAVPADAGLLAVWLVEQELLTPYQVLLVRIRQYAELVVGNYEILDRIGAGGMGTVYRARHRRMKRLVALKVLAREVASSPEAAQRFQREVEAISRLSHPNIVMAFDADEAAIGPFLVMEFVQGRDLASTVHRDGPMPLPLALDCLTQAARGLAYAHDKDIIHRDVKPANLLRDISGLVKVADLGLARVHGDLARAGERGLTQVGGVVGTVDFMPPEQAFNPTAVDQRADIYSLGCTLHFLLTGEPPFQGPTVMATMLKHAEAAPPELARPGRPVPAALETLVRRMLAKDPADRPASMAEVLAELERIDPACREAGRPVPVTEDRDRDPRPTIPAAGETHLAPAVAPIPAGGLAVLLVEPSRMQAGIIRRYLSELGLTQLHHVTSGAAALSLTTTPVGVVLSAMHLPDMTGTQLVQRMRANPTTAAPAFVLITSQADEPGADLIAHLDRAAVLSKPFDQAHLGEVLQRVQPAAALQEGGRSLASLRVLLVDDSASARRHVRNVLTGLNLESIVEAVDGPAAVSLLGQSTFDLLVTDFNMPGMTGGELIGWVRQNRSTATLPVIMVTTETDPTVLEPVRRLGVLTIVDKSCPQSVLRGVLSRLVN